MMKKVFLAAVIAVVLALSAAGPAFSAQKEAQTGHPGVPVQQHIDVCVNASNAAAAKALYPTARLHIVPDDPNPELNGMVVITTFGDKHPMTDAQEKAVRMRLYQNGMRGE